MPNTASSTDTATVRTTGRKLLKAALLKLGAYDPDEELQASDQTSGQDALNLLLDSANLEKLLVYAMVEETVDTAEREPTIGPGGDLDIIRPSKLEDGQVYLRSDESDFPTRMMTLAEWSEVKSSTSTGRPSAAYYEPSFPLGVLHFDVEPDDTYTLAVFPWVVLNQISNMQAEMTLPPGYFRWLVYELALDLRPEYPSATADMVIIAETARVAKAAIKRLNNVTPDIRCDLALRSSGAGYDIRTDKS